MKKDISKFSFPEMFNNSDGKTSCSKVVGFEIITVSCLCLIACTVGLFLGINVVGFASILAGTFVTGAGLVGYSKNQSLKFGKDDSK